jgi:hypothetical protein
MAHNQGGLRPRMFSLEYGQITSTNSNMRDLDQGPITLRPGFPQIIFVLNISRPGKYNSLHHPYPQLLMIHSVNGLNPLSCCLIDIQTTRRSPVFGSGLK